MAYGINENNEKMEFDKEKMIKVANSNLKAMNIFKKGNNIFFNDDDSKMTILEFAKLLLSEKIIGENENNIKQIDDKNYKKWQEQQTKGKSKKLSDEQVKEIKKLFSDGKTKSEIAKKFGVVHGTIRYILKNF